VEKELRNLPKELEPSKLIVFVGQSGAGKTTITEAMGCRGVASCEILRAEVARRDLEDNHANIHAVAMNLISKDPAWQAKQVLEMVDRAQPFIFDGPRNPADIQFLIDVRRNVEVVGVYSSRAVRYQRVLDREQKRITKEEFMQRCVDEVIEAGLNQCLCLATVFVFNNGNSLEKIRQNSVLLMDAIQTGDYPEVEPEFDGTMFSFERFIDGLSVPFCNSMRMRTLMTQYLGWEEEQLRRYQKGEIPLERFL